MSFFSNFSNQSRERKLALFNATFQPNETTRIIDIGAETNPTGNRHLQLIDSYPWKQNIVALNLSPDHIATVSDHYPEVDAVVGDACDLQYPDDHFDVVYSNAVIEHVGDFEAQRKMASEIMRVAKNWFVTTPNRLYPFEFHMRLPLVTWLPWHGYLRAGQILTYNHAKKKYTRGSYRSDLRLMTANELQTCFPTSEIVQQRITFMPETLIAVGSKS